MTKTHYVLEIKIIEVENEVTEVYSNQTRQKESVKTGNRTTKEIVNLHVTGDELAKIIGQAGEHLYVVGKQHYSDAVNTLKQYVAGVGGNDKASDEGYSFTRPIKDNPQA